MKRFSKFCLLLLIFSVTQSAPHTIYGQNGGGGGQDNPCLQDDDNRPDLFHYWEDDAEADPTCLWLLLEVDSILPDVTAILKDSGDSITLTALPNADEESFNQVDWQTRKDGGNWEDLSETGDSVTLDDSEQGTFEFQAKHGPDDTFVSSGSVYVINVEMDPVERGSGIPHSVVPEQNRDINVTISPTGQLVSFEVLGSGSGNGNAIIIGTASARTNSGTITLLANVQTDANKGGNLKIQASIDDSTIDGDGFSVCAHPINFAPIPNMYGPNQQGELVWNYGWQSDTGDLEDLTEVSLGEHVSYSGVDAPDPPFDDPGWALVPDPTVTNDAPGERGQLGDRQRNLPMAQGPAATWDSEQHFRFSCDRCGLSASNTTDSNLLGPLEIKREVYWDNSTSKWMYKVTKDGVTAYLEL